MSDTTCRKLGINQKGYMTFCMTRPYLYVSHEVVMLILTKN